MRMPQHATLAFTPSFPYAARLERLERRTFWNGLLAGHEFCDLDFDSCLRNCSRGTSFLNSAANACVLEKRRGE